MRYRLHWRITSQPATRKSCARCFFGLECFMLSCAFLFASLVNFISSKSEVKPMKKQSKKHVQIEWVNRRSYALTQSGRTTHYTRIYLFFIFHFFPSILPRAWMLNIYISFFCFSLIPSAALSLWSGRWSSDCSTCVNRWIIWCISFAYTQIHARTKHRTKQKKINIYYRFVRLRIPLALLTPPSPSSIPIVICSVCASLIISRAAVSFGHASAQRCK